MERCLGYPTFCVSDGIIEGWVAYFYMDDNAGKEKQIVIQKNGEIVSIENKKGLIKKTRNKQNIGISIYMISFI